MHVDNKKNLITIKTYKSKLGLNADIIEETEKNEIFNKQNNNDKITLNFECESNCETEELSKIFDRFIKHVKSLSDIYNTNVSNIEIFKIKLIKNVIEIEIDNPEFAIYEEKKNTLIELTKNNINEGENKNNPNGAKPVNNTAIEIGINELKQNILSISTNNL